MEAAARLIEKRNEESERGIFVVVYVHGWQNNADPNQTKGDLIKFQEGMLHTARELHEEGGKSSPDRVVGVYIGWRGATSRVPVSKHLTFWDRLQTAERIASNNMRETLFRILIAAKQKPDSKCYIVGHSMGGMIVGKALSPSMITLMLANGDQGTQLAADMILLLNPALEGLAAWQMIDFLKRSNARLELRSLSGETSEAPGPAIVSITSEADNATGAQYTMGKILGTWKASFRSNHKDPRPSDRYLATHAEGHIDYLISHRAWVEDGKVVLERVSGAFNDTPYWIIQVSSEISKDHGDTNNPMLSELLTQISQMNRLYETGVQTWMLTGPSMQDADSVK